MSIYGCDSCKYLRRKISELNKKLRLLEAMKRSLEETRRAYGADCEGYNMPVCVDICPAYPACQALEAGKPKPPRKRRKRVE